MRSSFNEDISYQVSVDCSIAEVDLAVEERIEEVNVAVVGKPHCSPGLDENYSTSSVRKSVEPETRKEYK